ncbi:MAG: hypothetical protein J7M25_11195 [Deltaproteobacteria bacterium]|nr:hypothetical protein [Deltaproteobacteria bacterium]
MSTRHAHSHNSTATRGFVSTPDCRQTAAIRAHLFVHYEIRVVRGYRITFQRGDEVIIGRRIGTHDVLNKP